MNYRKLRIAWSVACGVACVLWMALWVRGYWYSEGWNWLFTTRYLHLSTDAGRFNLGTGRELFTSPGWYQVESDRARWAFLQKPTLFADPSQRAFLIGLPYWLLLLGTATLAALPWASARFSLRALLIVITLVALGLGAFAWAN